jgi:hypothetical protein
MSVKNEIFTSTPVCAVETEMDKFNLLTTAN